MKFGEMVFFLFLVIWGITLYAFKADVSEYYMTSDYEHSPERYLSAFYDWLKK